MPRQITTPKVAAGTADATSPEAKEEKIRRQMALAARHVSRVALSSEDCTKLLDMLGLDGGKLGHTSSPLTSDWSNSWKAAT